jgi:hypothetical protein
VEVKEGNTHPPEDCNPLVVLGLVVSEAAYLVAQHLLVEGGNLEHVGASSLHSHCKLLHRHFHRHR